jgi:hypothetical protein
MEKRVRNAGKLLTVDCCKMGHVKEDFVLNLKRRNLKSAITMLVTTMVVEIDKFWIYINGNFRESEFISMYMDLQQWSMWTLL